MVPGKPFAGIDTWIFDLDNTLYPATSAVFEQVEIRIRDYIAGYLGLSPEEAFRLQKEYFLEFGTSMRGMMHHHRMPPGPYLDYVHDIDVSIIDPSPALERAYPGTRFLWLDTEESVGEVFWLDAAQLR